MPFEAGKEVTAVYCYSVYGHSSNDDQLAPTAFVATEELAKFAVKYLRENSTWEEFQEPSYCEDLALAEHIRHTEEDTLEELGRTQMTGEED